MAQLAIALDLGTSGFRGQALELPAGRVLASAMTRRHPLPGANVTDHLLFALEMGSEVTAARMTQAVNATVDALGVPTTDVSRLALSGNPIQLSLLQGLEIRDLAYPGASGLEQMGITPPKREAARLQPSHIRGLALPQSCEVLVPPAVRNEVGADALAMVIQTGMLEAGGTALAIDFGTNAEMALLHDGVVRTASAAAGPAIEGQSISCGMLAAPGAVCDLEPCVPGHRLILLNDDMLPSPGATVDLAQRVSDGEAETSAVGITGTGTIAIVSAAMQAGLIALPKIETGNARLHLGTDLYFTETDLTEAGKAFAAIRAGYLTLCHEAGIGAEEIHTAYMCGASGTYVDAAKALNLGLVPPRVECVYQVGNTSLAMARDLAIEPNNLGRMVSLAHDLAETHCTLAASKAFKEIYIMEYSLWTEGMPMALYRDLLDRRGYAPLPPVAAMPRVHRTVERDMGDLGARGLVQAQLRDRAAPRGVLGCDGCERCVEVCPTAALSVLGSAESPLLALDESLCLGFSCRLCEHACPEQVLRLADLLRIDARKPARAVVP